MNRDTVHLSLNGRLVEIGGPCALGTLSDYLRYEASRPGTKVVCAEGDCGACTVLVARAGAGLPKFYAVNSCIIPVASLDAHHLVTVEGLACGGELDPIQASMVKNFGGQCGFCTPGFVMAITNLYESGDTISERKVKNYLTGNLCRCTGYTPIIASALDVDRDRWKPVSERYPFEALSAELIKKAALELRIRAHEREYYAPSSLVRAVAHLDQFKDARLVAGSTDLGVRMNKGWDPGPRLVSLQAISELRQLDLDGGIATIGACVTLSELQSRFKDLVPEFSSFLNIFASPQIKNAATLIGNLANASPIADTTPFLMAADAEALIVGAGGDRVVPIATLFKGYRSLDVKPGEVIRAVRFRIPSQARIGLYKASQRRDLDISCVNSSFIFEMQGARIQRARISYGGVAATPLRLLDLEKKLQGQTLSNSLWPSIQADLAATLRPLSDARGSAAYRMALAEGQFKKFLNEVGRG